MKKPDLSKLTKEQKLALLDILEEKSRRRRAKKEAYSPNTGQDPVHRSPAGLRLVTSGNGSGKTTLGVQEALWAAEGFNPVTGEYSPVPSRVVVVLDHPDKVQDVWLEEMQKWRAIEPERLRKHGKPYVTEITFPNGSQILFFFHQQEALAFESLEVDFVVFDEPPPRHVFVALFRGGRKKGRKARFLIIGTPISAAWLRKEVYEPWSKGELEDTECFRFGTKVNEVNLAEGYVERFGRALTEKERRIRFDGEFFDLDGLALAHLFDRTVHVVDPFEWPSDWPVVVAVDPHPRKQHHAVMLGCDENDQFYVIKELATKQVPRDFAETLKNWYRGYRVIDLICDNLGSAEGTGGEGFRSFIQVLNDQGVRIRATSFEEKEDEAWIARIQDALVIPTTADNYGRYEPKLKVFRSCPGVIGDIECVSWTKMRNIDEFKPKLDIQNRDFLSCVKYALATNLFFGKEKAKKWSVKPGIGSNYGVTPKRGRLFYRRNLLK